jgi:hypothetical protein
MLPARARLWSPAEALLCEVAALSRANAGREGGWPVVVVRSGFGLTGPAVVRLPEFRADRTCI